MNAEALFWEVVRSAPLVEARQMLTARRQDAIARQVIAKRVGDGIEVAELNLLLTKINDEMGELNRVDSDAQFKDAVIALFGAEGWDRVKIWLAQNTEGRA